MCSLWQVGSRTTMASGTEREEHAFPWLPWKLTWALSDQWLRGRGGSWSSRAVKTESGLSLFLPPLPSPPGTLAGICQLSWMKAELWTLNIGFSFLSKDNATRPKGLGPRPHGSPVLNWGYWTFWQGGKECTLLNHCFLEYSSNPTQLFERIS